MHAVFILPGIMGTELLHPLPGQAPEMVWPPTPLETQFGYRRLDKLMSSAIVPGKIIENVLCFDFYGPLIALVRNAGFTETGATKRLYRFPYDWRLDLFVLARQLAVAVAGAVTDGATKVTIVGHSMGGLIARLVLEDESLQNEPWFKAVDQFIAIATPHLGAPLALARVLGLDSALGISGADFARLARQPGYPSAYQLLPAPGEAACWNQSDLNLRPLDIYEPEVAAKLGLVPQLLDRAKAVHAVLGAGRAHPNVRYFFLGATGHRTVTRVNVFPDEDGGVDVSQSQLTWSDDGGDGTVPLYSALPRAGQRQVVTNEHSTAFKGRPFRNILSRLLGASLGPALESSGDIGPDLRLSVESPIVTTAQAVEVLLFTDDDGDAVPAIPRFSGTFVLTLLREGEANRKEICQTIAITYDGPAISQLRLRLEPITKAGHYGIELESTELSVRPTTFSVCDYRRADQ